MASVTLKLAAFFPPGTTIEARPRAQWGGVSTQPPEGAPSGAAADSKVSGADGAVTFTGLDANLVYRAWVPALAALGPAFMARDFDLAEVMTSAGGGVMLAGADATGIADSTVSFQNAHETAALLGANVLVAPGTYTVSQRLHGVATTAAPVRFVAMIPDTVVIQRTVAVPMIDVTGSKSATVALAADVAAGSVTLTVAGLPAGGLVADDHVELNSTVLFATGVGSSAATVAELVRVKSVAGAGPYTITLHGPTEEAYAVANGGTIARVDFAGAGSFISGITFRQTAQNRDDAQFPLVSFNVARGMTIEMCSLRDADVPGIQLKGCLRADIDRCRFENLTDNIGSGFIGYGVNLGGNCRDIRITRPIGRAVRHVVTTSWGAGDVGVSRHILVSHGQAYETSAGPWNTHKEGKFITFDSCEAHGDKNTAFYIRSPFTTLVNPTVVNCGAGGLVPQIAFAETEASDGRVLGGTIVGGPNSQNGVYSTSPRTRVIATSFIGNGNGNLIKFDTGATDWTVDNVYCKDPTAGQHISAAAGCTGVIRGGTYVASGLKAIVSATTAGQVRFCGQAVGTNIFQIDQNQRAITDTQNTVQSKTGNYTLIDQDGTVLFDATAAVRTATLPAPTAAHVGREHFIIKKDASINAVSIVAAGGTLFGTSNLVTQGQKVKAVCDGTNWYVS